MHLKSIMTYCFLLLLSQSLMTRFEISIVHLWECRLFIERGFVVTQNSRRVSMSTCRQSSMTSTRRPTSDYQNFPINWRSSLFISTFRSIADEERLIHCREEIYTDRWLCENKSINFCVCRLPPQLRFSLSVVTGFWCMLCMTMMTCRQCTVSVNEAGLMQTELTVGPWWTPISKHLWRFLIGLFREHLKNEIQWQRLLLKSKRNSSLHTSNEKS